MAVVKGVSVVTTSTSTKSAASTRPASGRDVGPVERVKSAPASGKSRASATVVQGTRSSTPLDNGSTSIQSMPIPSASGRCEGEGFPPSVSISIVRGPLSATSCGTTTWSPPQG